MHACVSTSLALPWVLTTHPPCQSLFVHLSLLISKTTSVAINWGLIGATTVSNTPAKLDAAVSAGTMKVCFEPSIPAA